MTTHPSDNPSAFWGTVLAAVGTFLALLVSFGVPITDEQETAILAFLTAFGPVLTAFLISRRAWKPETVRLAAAGAVPPPAERLPRDERGNMADIEPGLHIDPIEHGEGADVDVARTDRPLPNEPRRDPPEGPLPGSSI